MKPTGQSKPMSRQRAKQLQYRAAGLCEACGTPSQGRCFCDGCAAKRMKPGGLRRPLKSEWDAVNWNLPIRAIAQRMGVGHAAVYHQRRLREAALAFILVHPDKLQHHDTNPNTATP